MKKYSIYKTIQLLLLLLITVGLLLFIFPNAELFHRMANDGSVKVLGLCLWAVLGISFLFILLDYVFFFGYRREYGEMEYALSSDPVSGLANRLSCDMLIEKYSGKPLPKDMGCIMVCFSNLAEINASLGHSEGNAKIRDFAEILSAASKGLCFVGRNGGNNFLCLFESCTEEDIDVFLERLNLGFEKYNSRAAEGQKLRFETGLAFDEGDKVSSVNELIALASSRVSFKVD